MTVKNLQYFYNTLNISENSVSYDRNSAEFYSLRVYGMHIKNAKNR